MIKATFISEDDRECFIYSFAFTGYSYVISEEPTELTFPQLKYPDIENVIIKIAEGLKISVMTSVVPATLNSS